ncbi:MAG TPA: DUF4276 family protein [Longimicrobium sp.]
MHIEILVEEPSAAEMLQVLAPELLGPDVSYEIRVFQGKPDLLRQLPNRLRSYPDWLPHTYGPNWCVVVLVDEDREDCRALKQKLETLAIDAGLTTRSQVRAGVPGPYRVVNRIAIEEIEAWFFGDVDALRAAYPRVTATLGAKAGYRDPDAIGGGTAEALERELRPHYPAGMPKVEVARTIAPHMVPDRNRSRSFQVFRDALRDLVPP